MRRLITILTLAFLSCSSPEANNMDLKDLDLESLAHEGIAVDLIFTKKPMLGELFLMTGRENPNYPPSYKDFTSISNLGIDQIDDYFGIRNKSDIGDDVKIWIFPLVDGKSVYHHEGPFDGLRLEYSIVRNISSNKDLFRKVCLEIQSKLNTRMMVGDKEIKDFNEIENLIITVLDYCKDELNVEPGSSEAMYLEW